jgi:hypothetical protein
MSALKKLETGVPGLDTLTLGGITGDTLNLGTSRLVRQGALHFADITRPMDGPTVVSGEYDALSLDHRRRDPYSRLLH